MNKKIAEAWRVVTLPGAWLVDFLARPVVNNAICVLILAAVIYCGVIGEPFLGTSWAVIGVIVAQIPGFLDQRDER